MPQVDTTFVFLTASSVSSSMITLFAAGVLFVISQNMGYRYQRYWALAWTMIAAFTMLGSVSLFLRIFNVPVGNLKWWLTCASQVGVYGGPVLMAAGCIEMYGRQITRNQLAIAFVLITFWAAFVASAFPDPQLRAERYALKVGLSSTVSAVIMSIVAFFTLRYFKDSSKQGPKIFAYSIFAYGFQWGILVVTAINFLMGGTMYRHTGIFGIVGFFVQGAVIYGSILWCIENEKEKVTAIQQQLEDQSWRDALTGLFNRRWLERQCKQLLNQCLCTKPFYAVMFIDLDGFKQVNDRLGHKIGDHLLIQVAKTLTQHLHEPDALCRIGGDEFVLVCTSESTKAKILARANALRLDISSIDKIDGHEVAISCSIGIATSCDSEQIRALTEASDIAMYAAKRRGKNTVQFAEI